MVTGATMLKRRGRGSAGGGKLAVTAAVALQDHIIRSVPLLHPPRLTRTPQNAERGASRGDEQEYDLDPGPAPLSLAQKLGLVAAPCRTLSVGGWMEVKCRSVQEGDSAQPCIICTEDFRLQPQVLLSCSHVFHKACLRAFERFSGRKRCPLCRTEQYQTRVIFDGARLYREKCALRIQACWRGYSTRKWYRGVRKTEPPKDPGLRRRFYEQKFQEMNESLVQSCSTDIDSFLREMDRSVSASRDVFHRFDRLQNSFRGTEEEWTKVQEEAAQRDLHDCPICLTALGVSALSKPVVLLSCSHLFHRRCLEAFERFCPESGATCPLCRRHYSSRAVQDPSRYVINITTCKG